MYGHIDILNNVIKVLALKEEILVRLVECSCIIKCVPVLTHHMLRTAEEPKYVGRLTNNRPT